MGGVDDHSVVAVEDQVDFLHMAVDHDLCGRVGLERQVEAAGVVVARPQRHQPDGHVVQTPGGVEGGDHGMQAAVATEDHDGRDVGVIGERLLEVVRRRRRDERDVEVLAQHA